jgi:TusA-related sulfurtransferase
MYAPRNPVKYPRTGTCSNMMKTVDARRLLCPMPVIRLQDAAENLQPGDRIHLIATDPGVKNDIPAWCRINGHEVESIEDLEHDEIAIRVCIKA